jgi:hypothetical protein
MKSKVTIFLFYILFVLSFQSNAQENLAGHWTFDDAANLTTAAIGNNLILMGNHSAVPGPDENDGAVQIGVGSHYIAPHGIPANGWGSNVNEFTIVMDIKVAQLNQWYCLYQTNQTNQNDGECFINPSGRIGVGATGYTNDIFEPDEWYRIAVVVRNGYEYDYYVDGQLALIGSHGSIDGRFSLGVTVLFFADENQEDNLLDVADIKLFSKSLSAEKIQELGGYGHEINDDPPTDLHTYLQTPTATSIFVCWHDIPNTNSHIEYGQTEALGFNLNGTVHQFNDLYRWHWAKLENLQPETGYYYKIVLDSLESPIRRFRTQPPDGNNSGHIRFAVVGDNRTDIDRHTWVMENMKTKMVELYGENYEDSVNCVLNVGDIVTNGNNLSEYRAEYFNPISSLSGNVPFMVSIGNHEREAQHYYDYMKYEDVGGSEGEKYYSFVIGRVLFVAINSNSSLRNAAQIEWLDNLLNSAQQNENIDWIFTFCHHPGRSELWPDGNTNYVQYQVIPTLLKYDKVDALMYGHSHNYEQGATQEGNIRLLLSGGAGSALDRWRMYSNQTNYPEIQRSFDHYCYVIFDIDIVNKKYQATTYSLGHLDKILDNVVIDEFYRDKANELPPEKPSALYPEAGTIAYPPLILQASGFSGSHDLMSSHFQLSGFQGNYSFPLVNKIRDFEDLYFDTAAPNYEIIDLNEGIDLTKINVSILNLEQGATYYWRVRYRDKNLQWSEWSEESSFIFEPPSRVEENLKFNIQKNELHTNYPNPFNSSTIINFDLKESASIEIIVFDINGKIVRNLDSGIYVSGSFQVEWDGLNNSGEKVATGIYFIKLETSKFVKVIRAVYLK